MPVPMNAVKRYHIIVFRYTSNTIIYNSHFFTINCNWKNTGNPTTEIEMLLQDICQRRSTRFWKSSSCKFKFNRTRWFGKRILRKGKDTLFHKDNSCLRNAQRTNVIISFLLDASASVHFHMWLCFLLDNASRKLTTNRKLLYCTF